MTNMELNQKIEDITDNASKHYELQEKARGNTLLEEKFEEVKNTAKLYFAIEIGYIIEAIDVNDEILVRKLKKLKELLYLIDMDVVADEIKL